MFLRSLLILLTNKINRGSQAVQIHLRQFLPLIFGEVRSRVRRSQQFAPQLLQRKNNVYCLHFFTLSLDTTTHLWYNVLVTLVVFIVSHKSHNVNT